MQQKSKIALGMDANEQFHEPDTAATAAQAHTGRKQNQPSFFPYNALPEPSRLDYPLKPETWPDQTTSPSVHCLCPEKKAELMRCATWQLEAHLNQEASRQTSPNPLG